MRTDPITVEWLVEFLDGWEAAYETGDSAAMVTRCRKDVVFDDSTDGSAITGREELAELLDSIFGLPGSPAVVRRAAFIGEDGTSAAVLYETTRSVPDTEPAITESAELFEFDDAGAVSRWSMFVRDLDWIGGQVP